MQKNLDLLKKTAYGKIKKYKNGLRRYKNANNELI
jgi:hypothetical protein